MIETSDIYRSIKELLENTFVDIPVQNKDFKTPNPPCFYIKYITGTKTQTADDFEQNDCSFDIIYFSKNESLLELFEIKEKLEYIFKNPIKIVLETKTQYQEIDTINTSLNETDYVVNCTIAMTIDQRSESNNEQFEIKDKNGNVITTGTKNRHNEYENNEDLEEIEYTI